MIAAEGDRSALRVHTLLAHQLSGVGVDDVEPLGLPLRRLLSAVGDIYTAVLDSLGDGLCVLGATGELVFMNPQAELLLGWQLAELVGANLFETINIALPT